MKNEIGRKLTSLTIMAIMFAGGMTLAIPGFMPEVTAAETTSGLLTVSTTTLQGVAVLEIVVNDPDVSATDVDIAAISASVGGTSYDMTQATNGKWYVYVVDASQSALFDADNGNGFEFGLLCSSGLGTEELTTDVIVSSSTNVYAAVVTGPGVGTITSNGTCLDADGMTGVLDDTSGTTSRQDLTTAVLQNAPSLSNPDGDEANQGQRAHKLNASGYGSWPYIVSVDLTAGDNLVEYGSDSINVVYGNTDADSSIELTNRNPGDQAEVHMTITDPALNIDPTTADIWSFDLTAAATGTTVIFSNNGTNSAMDPQELGQHGCVDNCRLSTNSQTGLGKGLYATTAAIFTETGASTDVFESFDATGAGSWKTIPGASGDGQVIYSYGGNSVDQIITYNDATITMDAGGGDWAPGTTATITVVDPEANRNPTSAETLNAYDETVTIPTILMGTGGLTLAGGANPKLSVSTGGANTNVAAASSTGVNIGEGDGGMVYTLTANNTTDNSERLRIIHSAGDMGASTSTWLNVTTGHTRADLQKLAGTVVLNYDIRGYADLASSTGVTVFVTDAGDNVTDNAAGIITVEGNAAGTGGNVKSGSVDLDDTAQYFRNPDVSAVKTWSGTGVADTSFVTVNFRVFHAATAEPSATADYAISADFCNFDQANGSLTHNCIYRLEAVETGENTGVFEGTVEYLNLNNSTTGGSISGEHDGGDQEVESLLGYIRGDALTVVLMDSVSGSDSVRVVYNDTDAFQTSGGTKIGAQLETSTHTGDISLDADSYGAADIATITIVDADLNTDSAARDTYQNSSTTFNVTITQSGKSGTEQLIAAAMTIIETGDNTGVFVGTFAVPNYKGSDMELTYYDSKDAGGSAVAYYDTATVVSNSGSVAFDRSVYPVPWTSGDLRTGSNNESLQTEGGAVTAWITVSDADETNDTLTTSSGSTAGTLLIKHTNSTGTSTIFTAGSAGGAVDATAGSRAAELGALSEIVIGSSEFEISMSISETLSNAAGTLTVQAGDVIQAWYVDTADSAGSTSTFYDSSTFDLRTGTLSIDKDVYVMGSDMVVTITDPDLNLDSGTCESYAMSIIEWDSAADSSQLLATSSASNTSSYFSSNPSAIEETGCDTGVFQTVVTLPVKTIGDGGDPEYGETFTLTYRDVGLSGESDVEGDTADIEAYGSISNFGALIELDKALYNWTDTVYITITAPDHNNNTAAEETIGTSALPIQVTSRNGKMCTSANGSAFAIAAETGPDTGVFTMEVALTGYSLTAAHNTPSQSDACSATSSTAGSLQMAGQTDGVSVSYEYTDSVVVVASASVAFNIAEAGFDTSSASAGGSATLTVTDADENTNSAIIDTFNTSVFSDSDNGGFTLVMNETDEDTGVFEGTVYFTATDATSGSNLRVSEGDTVTAEYADNTLPEPYTDSDSLTVASTLTIGTAFPPLERAPAANARVVDAFGSSVAEVSAGQQVQIAADVSNGQSGDQAFAYLVQVQDGDGVTVSLAWITGSLTAGQSMSPALSWTPSASGSYTATVFVWESVDNPTALSPTTSVDIDVV